MPRILTGIQSSGSVHLGNIMGAIMPSIQNSKKEGNDSIFFIADLHSLTTLKDPLLRENFVQKIAAAWISFGLDTKKTIFFRQSKVPIVCELKWYFECVSPFPMLANAHSFKDKSENLANVNCGIFTYPVLMAADILLYSADIVPVGKDQKQHLEITRDIARFFNNKFGNIFKIPKAKIDSALMTIPGTDGRKMSKSYNNIIDIFSPEKDLKKQIMSIKTDSKAVEEPKNPDECNIFKIYKVIASNEEITNMTTKYLNGNFGYGEAKKELLNSILEKFKNERKKFNEILQNPKALIETLEEGEKKANDIASSKMNQIRKILKFK